jgi:hypothetical protein
MSDENKQLNQDKGADNAETALKAHAEALDMDFERNQATAVYLLSNLMHWCDVHGVRYALVAQEAEKMYREERP